MHREPIGSERVAKNIFGPSLARFSGRTVTGAAFDRPQCLLEVLADNQSASLSKRQQPINQGFFHFYKTGFLGLACLSEHLNLPCIEMDVIPPKCSASPGRNIGFIRLFIHLAKILGLFGIAWATIKFMVTLRESSWGNLGSPIRESV